MTRIRDDGWVWPIPKDFPELPPYEIDRLRREEIERRNERRPELRIGDEEVRVP